MSDTLNKRIRRWLGETAFIKIYRKYKLQIQLPKYYAIKSDNTTLQHKSIIFLCPARNLPLGGVKVIYNQAAIINRMNGKVTAKILHPYNPNYNCTWFEHGAALKRDLGIDRQNDFVMIPEFWTVHHPRLLYSMGVRYGIYVQGGYIIGLANSDKAEERDAAYHNAAFILAISDDTVECIKMAYPECAGKVYRVHCSVNPNKFVASSNKEDIICYMPRRLKNHSKLVTFFLEKKIPRHWRIVSIDGLDENGVAEILGKSKIFLSFSELEGLSLPPIEAALSGCYVIGYTGQAAKEYWDTEIFTEIHSGDIKAFVEAVLNKIDEIDRSPFVLHTVAIQNLANRYSAQVEQTDMQFVCNKVIEILNDVV
jgi:glycosyltransferase involved in cell wall biosynthesis